MVVRVEPGLYSAARGQSAVLLDDDRVLGGGLIAAVQTRATTRSPDSRQRTVGGGAL